MKSPIGINNPPDLSKSKNQETYVQEAHNAEALLQKEMDVNRAEQDLIRQRMQMSKSFLNELPDSDPQYSMLRTQIQMDQIELDELQVRENAIADHLLGRKKLTR